MAAYLRTLIAVCLVFTYAAIEVEPKQIRSRNSAILTSPRSKAPGFVDALTNDADAAGLFPIQLSDPSQPDRE